MPATPHRLTARLRLELPRDRVFAFFADATNLERITPPELGFRILNPAPVIIGQGSLLDYRLQLHGIPFHWQSLISTWQPPDCFVDEQVRGPYHSWVHRHRFLDDGSGTVIEDCVDYRLPLGPLGRLIQPLVRLQLDRIFAYRQQAVIACLAEHPDIGTG
ncbi:MAG: SRPBCC family protein [Gemmatimonadota bacterium]